MINITNDWQDFFAKEEGQSYFQKLMQFIDEEYRTKTIFPIKENIWTAFQLTPYNNVSVVIIGQDPYHEVGQAHGLCFSVEKGTKIPPSLRNIFKEIASEYCVEIPSQKGNLTEWAKQGVLMINAVLTVEEGKAGSHSKKGWEIFTDNVISKLNERAEPIIFILWGNSAIQKQRLITAPHHHILTSTHPSPLSAHRGFLGCGHFKLCNNMLISLNKKEIDWLKIV